MKNYLLSFITTNLLLINSTSVIAIDVPFTPLLISENKIDCDQVAKVQNIAGKVILNRPNQKERPLQKKDFLCRNDEVKIDRKATLTVICNNKPTKNIPIKQTTKIICEKGCRYIHEKGCTRGGDNIAQVGKPNIIFPKNDIPISYNTKFIIKWDNVEGAIKYIVRIKRFRKGEIWKEITTNNQIEYPNLPVLEPGPSYDLIVEAKKNDHSVVILKTKFFITK
ncbi:MAG TPA: hypothetical protein V6C58_00525 [Allocoleopsis sp.]